MIFFRNTIALLIIVGMTIPNDAFRFVISIPDVVNHYNHHNEKVGKISFIDFINEHSDPDSHTHENHEHDKLPFNHHHSTDFNAVSSLIAFIPKENLKLIVSEPVLINIFLKNHFYSFELFKSIWQPPKYNIC